MKYLFSVLLLLIFCIVPATATDYTYRDGYWWLGDKAYTRQLYQNPGYWSYGVYYPGSYYYQYLEVPVATKTVYKKETVSYTDPGWRSKLLDIAAQRDKFEGEIRKNAHEQAYFLDGVKALGLQGNFGWSGYGAVPPGSSGASYGYGYGYASYGGAGANATTKYTYSNLSQLYGDGDLSQLYQAANQLAQNAQRLGGEATSGFTALAGQEGANRARVAEILAKGQMAQQVLQALETAPTGVTKAFSFKFNERGVFEKTEAASGVNPKLREELSEQFSAVASARCASCHSGATRKGGFDVYSYPSMSAEEKQRVWMRLATENEATVMPRTGDGRPGKRLTLEEFRAFLLAPTTAGTPPPAMTPVRE